VKRGLVEVIGVLLEAGADLDAVDMVIFKLKIGIFN